MADWQYWLLLGVIVACAGFLERRLGQLVAELHKGRVQYLEQAGRLRAE